MGSRQDLVAAAAKVMREQGYAHATTKAIAQAAGYSEALLYKHFRDKTALFLAVLSEELPALGATAARLTRHAADASLEQNLTELAGTALEFYRASFPISVSIFSSRDLLRTHRAALDSGHGPDQPIVLVETYLRAEAALGRIPAHTDLDAAARLLLGACFQQAFLDSFEDTDSGNAVAARLAKTVIAGLR
ncbi:TetR family transcriptional regulator [Amycolatopsis sp. NPDC050768]|uniref:TetR/AcrR family transcriptional regulator n=1 Tax=Amycolatopsis sp. NPDC050768 TaxID=3154839 RepID=UPI0033E88C12